MRRYSDFFVATIAATLATGLLSEYVIADMTVEPSLSWTVGDNIHIARLPSDIENDWSPSDFHVSPNRVYVAFNVLTSNLDSDETTSHLRIYRINDLRQFANGYDVPSPIFEKAVPSVLVLPGLGNFQWSADSDALFYLSTETSLSELRFWQVGRAKDQPVPGAELGAYNYQLVGAERVALFRALPEFGPGQGGQAPYAPLVATGHALPAIVIDWKLSDHLRPSRMQIVNWRNGEHAVEIDSVVNTLARVGAGGAPVSVSPDGSRLAFGEAMAARSDGRCWQADLLGAAVEEQEFSDPASVQIAFLDLADNSVHRPFSGPVGALSGGFGVIEVLWSGDSLLAIAPYTYTSADACSENAEPNPPGAYAFSFETQDVTEVRKYEIGDRGVPGSMPQSASWSDDYRSLALSLVEWTRTSRSVTLTERHVYRLLNGKWSEADSLTHLPLKDSGKGDLPVLEVRQDYNLPPAIFALNDTGEGRMLIDLAPHARNRIFGTIEEFEWDDDYGRPWKGLLALPPMAGENARLPLIIQTHGYHKGEFFAEGISTTMFPGRAALERGFAVITVYENRDAMFDVRADEGRNMVSGYQTAIQALERRGVIDPARVGAIGWSRTSYHVKYAAVHAPELFAAVVVGDGVDYGYWQFLGTADYVGGSTAAEYHHTYGGNPWAASDKWRTEAPGFNLGNVRAPVRVEANSGMSAVLDEWEFYAGMRRLRLPVDLIVYPDGVHSLVRPIERRSSTQGSIDWLDFWINDVEDSDPAKVAQYIRWRRMREHYESAKKAAILAEK